MTGLCQPEELNPGSCNCTCNVPPTRILDIFQALEVSHPSGLGSLQVFFGPRKNGENGENGGKRGEMGKNGGNGGKRGEMGGNGGEMGGNAGVWGAGARVCTMNCSCGRACAAKLASFKRHDGQLLNKPLCKHSEIAAGMFSKSSKALSNTYAGQQKKVAIKRTIALGCIAQLSRGTTCSSRVPVSLGPSSTGPSCVSSSTRAICEAFPDGCPTSFSGECSACCTQKQEDRHKHTNM